MYELLQAAVNCGAVEYALDVVDHAGGDYGVFFITRVHALRAEATVEVTVKG